MPVGINPKNIIVTQDGSQYQKADTGKVAAGVLVGDMAGGIALQSTRVLSAIPVSFAQNDTAVFKNSNLSQAIDIAFEKSGLANKGATFIDATEANSELVKEAIKKLYQNGWRKYLLLRIYICEKSFLQPVFILMVRMHFVYLRQKPC